MSKLDELIQELCPNGVERRPLEKCCEVLDKKRKPVTKAARVAGEYPYYGANGIQDYVSDYIFDGTFVLVGEDGSVLTSNDTPVVNWATGKIWVNNHAHIISEIDGMLLRYLFHYLQTINVKHLIHGNIPKLTGGDFRALEIPVPPLEVQSEIVRILDNFTELTAELTARKKQYEYYRDKLLSFNVLNCASVGNSLNNIVVMPLGEEDMNKLKELIQKLCSNGVEYKTIKETVGLNRGKRLTKSELLEESNTEFKYAVYHGSKDTPLGFYNNFNAPKGTTIVVNTGGIGGVKYIGENFWCSDGSFWLGKTNNINEKYLYYCLSGYEDYFSSKKRIGGVPTIDKSIVENFSIPVPPLEVQEEIVRILDKFTTLATSISEGLPKEIELRRKQYEYYRNQLLSFPDNKATA